jgi:hypothetical protein
MSTSVYKGLKSLNFICKTSYKSSLGKSLCTYKRCWKWCPRRDTAEYRSLSAQRLSERTVLIAGSDITILANPLDVGYYFTHLVVIIVSLVIYSYINFTTD